MFFLNWVLLRLNFVPYFLRLPRPCPLVGKRICLASLTVCPLLIILSVPLEIRWKFQPPLDADVKKLINFICLIMHDLLISFNES